MAQPAPSGAFGSVQPTAGQTLAALERLVNSPALQNSERLCRFLRYIVQKTVDGQGGDIKEYLIALEVYGRPASYDPKVDSIVRVEASRLRGKIREYYESDGREDEVRIDLPKGGYVPVLRLVRSTAVENPAVESAPVEPLLISQSELISKPRKGAAGYSRRIAALAITGLLISAAAGLFYWSRWSRAGGRAASPAPALDLNSIAVLPFLSLGEAAGQKGFADGLTEDITESLARGRDLRVAGRSAVSALKGSVGGIPALGRQLNVGAILDGSVRQDGTRMRITAQLVSTVDGFHLWSETYDREAKDRLALQTEVSRSIAGAVAAAVAGASSAFARQLLTEPEQVDLFRKGIQLLDWRYDHILLRGAAADQPQPLAELMRAVGHFEQVVTRDPRHARAWAALAHTYLRAAEYDPRLAAKSRAAAGRALSLNPRIGAAHAILGYGLFLQEWDFPAAEEAFRRGLELDPRLLGIYRLYGDCASLLGHQAEALALIERARNALPSEPLLRIARALALYHSRRYADMADEARELLDTQPNLAPGHWLLGLALEQMGRLDEAASAFERTLQMAKGDPRATTALGHVYGRMGKKPDALRIAAEYERRSQHSRPSYSIAMIQAGLGDREQSLQWLQRSFDLHETSAPYMKLDPRFDRLRGDSRFKALLAAMKL